MDGGGWFNRARSTLAEFLRFEAAGGILLMVAAVLAMFVANSPQAGRYEHALHAPIGSRLGPIDLRMSVLHWINDALMVVFFLLAGLELKREIVEGHLASLRRAALPAIAALGGMAAPALIYVAFNRADPLAVRGWAIPSATDIAFALGVLSLLGGRVPTALKAFLLSVAIFDDLGAILVIALFYTANLDLAALGAAGVVVLGLWALNKGRVRRLLPYLVLGIPLWLAVLQSGIHATIAGVLLAMFIPMRVGPESEARPSPLRRLEHAIHPTVAFAILPLFAFANAGVPLDGLAAHDLLHPVPLGIALGLLLGKLTGILGASYLAVRFGFAVLPDGARWKDLFGIALLAGIGFTMSLFIASLAFSGTGAPFLGLERLGILTGTAASGLCGYLALRTTLARSRRPFRKAA